MARLIGMRAVKAVAAATVCVAALSACTGSQRSPVSVPTGASLPRAGGMPGFYLVVSGLEVVVASADGRVTGSIAIPVPATTGRDSVGGQAFGSADGRHFVIVVSRGGDLPGVADVTQGMPVIGAALSPDGRMLALSLVHEFPPGSLYGSVKVINLVSGEIRTWTGQSTPGYWPGVPAWASDDTVVVPWWHSAVGMNPARPRG